MQRLWTLLLSCLIWASLAVTAQSQEGTSLYEPFPEPSSAARAERFVDQLRVPGGQLELSRDELERGVILRPGRGEVEPARVPAGAATERAAGGEGLAPSFGWLFGLALLGLAGLAAARLPRIGSRAA